MPRRFQIHFALPALLLAAALLAGCAEPVQVVARPPAPVASVVVLSPKVIQLASAYRHYMVSTRGISSDLGDGDGVARSVQIGAAYEPNQLVRGAIAYAAVVALQDRTFVNGVRAYAKDPALRREVAYGVLKDPAYAVGITGSANAAGLVIANLGADAQRLYDEGKAVKQSAYDLQRQPWSKAEIKSRTERLAAAKSVSAAHMVGDVAETARLQQAAMGVAAASVSVIPVDPPYSPTVTRGLAIAALAVLGEAGDANIDSVLGLMSEPNIGGCMNSSKLNLYQCLAVARPHYEDVFCLGQHAMMDTGRCVIRAAGLPEPYEARFIPDASSINKGMNRKPPAKKKITRKTE